MAEMTDKERVRLIKLCNYALNRGQKLGHCSDPGDTNKVLPKEEHAELLMIAKQLGAFGTLLDKDGEGEYFFLMGQSIARTPSLHLTPAWFNGGLEGIMTTFRRRHLEDNTQTDAVFEALQTEDQATDPDDVHFKRHVLNMVKECNVAMLGWEATGQAKKPQYCSFCGVMGREDRVLMACGRCKTALYCDQVCQRMHWKQGHKAKCVVKTNEKDEKEDVKDEAA